jgi:hypothetical protein
MAVLTADYQYEDRKDDFIQMFLIFAGATIYKGAMCCVNTGLGAGDGYLRAGADTAGFIMMGVAVEHSIAVAGEVSGSRYVRLYRTGSFRFPCAGATQAWVGRQVFVFDDNTVGLRQQVNNGVVAGIVTEFLDATHVQVNINCAQCMQWTEESWSSSSSCSSSSSYSSSSCSSNTV